MDTGIIRNPTSAKVDFCNTSYAKCLVSQSQTPRFKPKNHQKKRPGNKYDEILFGSKSTQKPLKMDLRNQPKVGKIQAWTSKCPFLCSRMFQDRPRIAPGSQGHQRRHQACQMTRMGTRNVRSVCKKTKKPASRSQ